MAMIKWAPMLDPFEEMDTMLDHFNGNKGMSFAPSMDIYQTDKEVVAEVSLPGIDPNNIEVAITNDVLIISGKSEKKSEVDDKNYYRKEVRCGSFQRSVALPATVNGDQAKAEYKDGILKVNIPKIENIKPKTIKVEIK
jgi:HSP20 family protein